VDDPKDKTFSAFGDARHKIEGGLVVHSRELYFATYQSIAKDERRPGLYKEFAPDFFDLIIVDECHRGSAKEDSNWREILEYFAPAYQIGMTATPLRQDNRDTYLYFGNPIYTYSLRQGIDDGSHAHYDETIYGVEGVMTFTVDGKAVPIGPGESCFIRRGAVHGFNNLQSVEAKALAVVTPALIGPGFFKEMAAIVNAGGPPDMAKIKETMLRHGLVPAPMESATVKS
jgi:mannose-6-phosphate isomerase-like protein (cupin superfamily)